MMHRRSPICDNKQRRRTIRWHSRRIAVAALVSNPFFLSRAGLTNSISSCNARVSVTCVFRIPINLLLVLTGVGVVPVLTELGLRGLHLWYIPDYSQTNWY